MELFLQQAINGLTIGSVYALVALGYTMVYGVLRLINFAHGELFMLGSYFAFTFVASLGLLSVIPSIFLALIAVFLLSMGLVGITGIAMERIAYRPLREAGRLPAVVSALGVSIFLQNAVMLTYGTKYKVYPEGIVPTIGWEIMGVEITLMRLIILVVAISLMFILYFFIQKTVMGMAIRAIALDHDTSRLMGIDVNRIVRLIFVIGPALGGAAGIMVGLFYRQINFTMGWAYGLKAFTAAILGGIGNIPGAMIGGMLLGVIETFGAGYISPQWKDAIAFFILIFILIFRPTGLLGERVAEKV